MKSGSLQLLLAVFLLATVHVGCGALQPSHAGIYVARIWTVPEQVHAGALVELHMDEVHDLPPGAAIPPVVNPVHWAVSAGELYEKTLDGEWLTPLDEQLGGQEIDSFVLVMWRAPFEARDVRVAAQQYGRPLTVTIRVYDPPIAPGLGGQSDLVHSIQVSDPEIHVNEAAMLMYSSRPRVATNIKDAALSPPVYDWCVTAGELFGWFPRYDEHGPLSRQGNPVWWRAPADPQTATVEFRLYYEPISTEIEVLPAP